MPRTILQSFNYKLPDIPSDPSVQYRTITASATSTRKKDAIPVFIREDVLVITKLGREVISNCANIFTLLHKNMPTLEKTHYLRTEADVLRAAILQLIHPVNILLEEYSQRLFPHGRLCTS